MILHMHKTTYTFTNGKEEVTYIGLTEEEHQVQQAEGEGDKYEWIVEEYLGVYAPDVEFCIE